MKPLPSLVTLIAAATLVAATPARADYITENAPAFKEAFKDAEPAQPVDEWLVPFAAPDRAVPKAYKVVSTYGSPRQSYVKGHWHTALDMRPAKRVEPRDFVFAMAKGVVVSIHLTDPHQTIVVKHKLKDGSTIFTSYKHLQTIFPSLGDQVDPTTKMGQLYNKAEAKKLGGDFDHLHLEIRKNFDDYGVASWATMNKGQLDERFFDPIAFMKANLGKVK